VRIFKFADHYHKKLDVQDDQTEYINHMHRMIEKNCPTKMTLPKKTDPTTSTSTTQDDPTSVSPKDKKIDILTDNNVTLPEHLSNYIFIYIKKFCSCYD